MKTPTPHTTKSTRHILSRGLRALHRDEQGTSMTEFIIGLPVMITIMVGTLSLYKLYQTSLETKGQSAREVWADTLPAQQSAVGTGEQMNLYAGAAMSAFDGSILSGGLLSGGGAGKDVIMPIANNPAGVYIDSYVKTQMANTLFDVSVKPGLTIKNILREDKQDTKSFTSISLAEARVPSFSGGGVAGAISGLVSGSGSRFPIVAGIRYGVGNSDVTRSYSAHGFSTEFSEQYSVSNPTKATNRIFATGLARLDLNAHPDNGCSQKHYKNMLKFRVFALPRICLSSKVKGPTDEDTYDFEAACAQKKQAWQNDPANNPKPRCAETQAKGGRKDNKGAAKDIKNKLVPCMQNAARNGEDPAEACSHLF